MTIKPIVYCLNITANFPRETIRNKYICYCRGYQKRAAELENNWRDHFEEQQSKKFDEKKTKQLEEEFSDERCGTRYQQTSIKVFARWEERKVVMWC